MATDVFGFIRYNPAMTLKLPKIEDEVEFEKHLYNQDEINTILERFKNDDVFTCAFITACYTGMRTGEVCSLTWDDIDFENRVINVKHTVYDKPDDGKGRWYMGTTKTKNGVRQIYMSPTLFQALINFKKKQQHLKKLYGSKYITYYFEDVIGKNGKLIERRIIENNGNILHMNIANLVFTRPNGKYVGRNILNYPFILRPSGKDYLWGGEKLKTLFGRRADGIVAESWEASVHRDGVSTIAGSGKTFTGFTFHK